jgi:hypothetical protein
MYHVYSVEIPVEIPDDPLREIRTFKLQLPVNAEVRGVTAGVHFIPSLSVLAVVTPETEERTFAIMPDDTYFDIPEGEALQYIGRLGVTTYEHGDRSRQNLHIVERITKTC